MANQKLRLAIEFTPNTQPVPWDYMHKQCGLFYRNLGITPHHDNKVSLYSYSMLRGEVINTRDGLYFPSAHMFVSAYEEDVIQRVRKGFLTNPEANFGMEVKSITLLETPKFREKQFFVTASGVLLRGQKEEQSNYRKMYVASDDEDITSEILTQNMKYKMDAAGISGNVKVYFAENIDRWRTKTYCFKKDNKDVHNLVSHHPVVVEGSQEIVRLAWLVGVGNSTGAGFGSLV